MKFKKLALVELTSGTLGFFVINILLSVTVQAQQITPQPRIESNPLASSISSFLLHLVLVFTLSISILAMMFSLRAWHKANAKEISIAGDGSREKRSLEVQPKSSGDLRSEILDDQEYIDSLQNRIIDRSASVSARRYLDYLEAINHRLNDYNISDAERAALTKQKKALQHGFEVELKNSSMLNKNKKKDSLRKLSQIRESFRNRNMAISEDHHPPKNSP